MNAEARAKVGAAQRGKPKSPEHRAKIGAANRKLTDTDVAAIRAEGNPNVRELAARFGVSETTIRRALTGESRLTARRP